MNLMPRTVVAIRQQGIRVATPRGLVNAQSLKVLRIDYAPLPRRVRLRSVGEVLTDQSGRFYELRGDHLHQLGELVTDRVGRVFEIANAPPAKRETEILEQAAAPTEPDQIEAGNARSILSRFANWFSRRLRGLRVLN